MAKPRLVYISHATELGTVYTRAELQGLSDICTANDLLLMLDGARLGVALTAAISDLTLNDIAELTDIFWIGGTKAGALLGEAIVIPDGQLAHEFAFHIKQRGGGGAGAAYRPRRGPAAIRQQVTVTCRALPD